MAIQRVGIVGCGLMGSGIAEVCARAGLDVLIREVDETALGAGRSRIERSLQRAQKAGKLGAEEAGAAFERIRFTTDLGSFADRELAIEAILEDEAAKMELFEQLDAAIRGGDAILASNTSSIPITRIAMHTARPDRVCGLHFFNPVPVLDLVELVPSELTSPDTVERLEAFARDVLGKHVIQARDRAGFIVNSLLIPYIVSAVRMAESGFATAEDIDAGMMKGCLHPMGPLALADLIGLDTTRAIAESLYREFKEPLYAPPPLLCRMVEAGRLGRKSGRGFYEYPPRGGAR